MVKSYMYENRTKSSERKSRESNQVTLRQQRRDDLLNKKRTTTTFSTNLPNFEENRQKIFSSNLNDIFEGTYEIRRLLSVENNPPINAVIESNILPRIVEFLSSKCSIYANGDPEIIMNIRTEAAWILTNIASGTTLQTEKVVELGAIRLLVNILNEPDSSPELVDQSVWALGNVAGDSESSRDVIINQEGGIKIAELIQKLLGEEYVNVRKNPNLKILRNCTWLLSNLCRGRDPPPSFDHLNFCLNFFAKLILCNDDDIVADSFWAMSYIADVDIAFADRILRTDTIKKAFILLDNYCSRIKKENHDSSIASTAFFCISPLLRTLGNIMTGTDEQTTYLLNFKVSHYSLINYLRIIFYGYDSPKKISRIRKEICWMLSNISAGTEEQVNMLINENAHLILLDALKHMEMFIKTEACWAMVNLLAYVDKNEDHFKLINAELIDALGQYLELCGNIVEIQLAVLVCFEKMLTAGDIYGNLSGQGNYVIGMFGSTVRIIEELQDVNDEMISEKAYHLIVKYFGGDEE